MMSKIVFNFHWVLPIWKHSPKSSDDKSKTGKGSGISRKSVLQAKRTPADIQYVKKMSGLPVIVKVLNHLKMPILQLKRVLMRFGCLIIMVVVS